MTMKHLTTLLIFSIALFASTTMLSQNQQKSFPVLTIIESSDMNTSLGKCSYLESEKTFEIKSENQTFKEMNINKILTAFVDLLKPEKSYVIQDGVSHYFVLQYNAKNKDYLVLDNSIGEKNEAHYFQSFQKAKDEMTGLLNVLYDSYKNASNVR